MKKKFNRKNIKMQTIYENCIFIEQPNKKYNQYNQISLIDIFMDFYISLLKFIF